MHEFLRWLFEFAVLWFSTGIVIIATGWYMTTIIETRWPGWWQRHIVGDDPHYGKF